MYIKRYLIPVLALASVPLFAPAPSEAIFGCCFGNKDMDSDMPRTTVKTPLLDDKAAGKKDIVRYVQSTRIDNLAVVGALAIHVYNGTSLGQGTLQRHGPSSFSVVFPTLEQTILLLHATNLEEIQAGVVSVVESRLFPRDSLAFLESTERAELAKDPKRILHREARNALTNLANPELLSQFQKIVGKLLSLEGKMYLVGSGTFKGVLIDTVNIGKVAILSGRTSDPSVTEILRVMEAQPSLQ